MNLTIDIGNTRTKFGFFKNGRLRKKMYWESTDLNTLIALLDNQKVENIICSTVKTVDPKFESILKTRFYTRLEANTPLPIQNKYRTPKTLGKDRLAAVVGAYHLYPGESSLVIDAGTCITYDVIDAAGNFLGGNIVPGMRMRWKAMHHFTAKLPLVDKVDKKRSPDIGKDTISALATGGALGTILEMDGWIQYFHQEYDVINTILTGGDGEYFAKRLKSKIFANPNLVLVGLNKILKHNVELLA